jgi:hypothetical protein
MLQILTYLDPSWDQPPQKLLRLLTMVAASSPFGLSKAALERRINNQLPRKRHTPYPITKSSTQVTPKHVARPKTRSKPANSSEQIDISRLPPSRPEKRGTDRSRTAGTNSYGISQWSARRILASRLHPSNPSKTLFKVQWETTWEDAGKINGLAVAEWREAVDDGSTFEFKAQDGSEWTVLKDVTSLENDSEESQWEMWRAIRRNVVKELDEDWFAGLKDGDFEFASEAGMMEVRDILKDRWLEQDISATNVLRAAWSQVSNGSELLETNIPLGSTKLRFVAQLDPWVFTEDEKEEPSQDQLVEFSVAEIIRARMANPLEALEDDTFSKGNANSNYLQWCETMKSLVRNAPFMFKSGTWLQLFAFLLLGSEILRGELASVGIKVQDDWCQRAREYDMHMYYEQIVDDRSIHEIQETFLNLRDFFRDLESDKRMAVWESAIDEKVTESGIMGGQELENQSMASD